MLRRLAYYPIWLFFIAITICSLPRPISAQPGSHPLGIFEDQSDVGSVTPPGNLAYDPAKGVYSITSAGENIWSKVDGFHFVWKKVSGDLSLTADIDFPVKAGDPSPHRKAVLMFRQTLDNNSIYADAAQHGSGLTALQYRRAAGATAQSIELDIASPKQVRLEKHGDFFTMFLSMQGEPLHQVGASIKLHLNEPFYAGIGLTAHMKGREERANFSNLQLTQLTPTAMHAKLVLYSSLQTISINESSPRATVVATQRAHFQSANWSMDGKSLVYTLDGQIWQVSIGGGTPQKIDIGGAISCSESHAYSHDGSWLGLTCSALGKPERHVYIAPSRGGAMRLVTENPNSYLHSWSPDDKTILFTRPGLGTTTNIYSISAEGGPETVLTTDTNCNDDPDYSPDGKYIYFNSDRSGSMQIWRMRPDGSQAEQITFDEFQNWSPHPSPDGKWIVFLSYDKSVTDHPADKDISLRILSTSDNNVRVLVNLIGGDGTINVPSWAPDSNHLAFVSYQMLPEEDAGPPQ